MPGDFGSLGPLAPQFLCQCETDGKFWRKWNGLNPIKVRASDFSLSGAIGQGRRRLNGTDVGTRFKKDTLQGIKAKFRENRS